MKRSSIAILGFMSACSVIPAMLRLQDRRLLIDRKSASLIYPTYVTKCKFPKRKFFRGCYKKRVIVKYDLSDLETRMMLINAKFQCESPMRFKYE